jgi:hypothetical protein
MDLQALEPYRGSRKQRKFMRAIPNGQRMDIWRMIDRDRGDSDPCLLARKRNKTQV